MKDTYNPLSQGIIQDSIGYIPAGPHNPEIYYTQAGEQTAAITLLTYLLMKQEVVDHLNEKGVAVIASETYDEPSEQILRNLKDGFPAGTIRDEITIADKHTNTLLGIAHQTENILRINYNSGHGQRQSLIKGMLAARSLFEEPDDEPERQDDNNVSPEEKLLTTVFAETADDDTNDKAAEENLIAEEDDLYASGGWGYSFFKISEILSAAGDQQALAKIMMRVQALAEQNPLRRIPRTVCHETGHVHTVERNILTQGLTANPTDAIADFKIEDHSYLDGEKIPPVLMEGVIRKLVVRPYEEKVMKPEMETAKLTAPNTITYYLAKTIEVKAELIGTALLEDIEAAHGLTMHKSVLKDYMPTTYGHMKKYLEQMQGPEWNDYHEYDVPNFDPDEKMADFAGRQSLKSYDLT